VKRWPIIRHIRWWLLRGRVTRVLTRYGAHGYLLVNLEDADLLGRVWRGEA
jgi:hypothetical protein